MNIVNELSEMAKSGQIIPNGISIKENIATIRFNYNGKDEVKFKQTLLNCKNQDEIQITLDESNAQSNLNFTIKAHKSILKGLLSSLSEQVHQLEVKIAAEKLAKRRMKKKAK